MDKSNKSNYKNCASCGTTLNKKESVCATCGEGIMLSGAAIAVMLLAITAVLVIVV